MLTVLNVSPTENCQKKSKDSFRSQVSIQYFVFFCKFANQVTSRSASPSASTAASTTSWFSKLSSPAAAWTAGYLTRKVLTSQLQHRYRSWFLHVDAPKIFMAMQASGSAMFHKIIPLLRAWIMDWKNIMKDAVHSKTLLDAGGIHLAHNQSSKDIIWGAPSSIGSAFS